MPPYPVRASTPPASRFAELLQTELRLGSTVRGAPGLGTPKSAVFDLEAHHRLDELGSFVQRSSSILTLLPQMRVKSASIGS